MTGLNEWVTVLNRRYDPDAGADVYHAAVLRGASWQAEVAGRAENRGLAAKQQVRVCIAEDARCAKRYVPAGDWDNPQAQYTLRVGDVLVRGVLYEVPAGLAPEVFAAGYERCTVTGWRDNRGRLAGHLVVEGW